MTGPAENIPSRYAYRHVRKWVGRISRRLPLTPYTHFIGSLWITVAVLGIWVAAFEDCHESSKAASSVGMATFGHLRSQVL